MNMKSMILVRRIFLPLEKENMWTSITYLKIMYLPAMLSSKRRMEAFGL